MTSGDLTIGTISVCTTEAEITTAVNGIGITTQSGQLMIIPAFNMGSVLVFKVEMEA